MASELARPWKIIFKGAADRQIKLLPAAARRLALVLIEDLRTDALIVPSVRLREHSNAFRIRFGESFNHPGYRLLYDLFPRSRKVVILRVGPRPTVYEGLPGSGQKKIR